MTVKLFKMARVECDDCETSYFDVYTHEDWTEAPVGWTRMQITGYAGYGYGREYLCCPECTQTRKSDKNNYMFKETPSVKLKDGWRHDH